MNGMKPKIDKQGMIESARIAARVQGCLCHPDVELREMRTGVFVADVSHAGRCPLAPRHGADE